MRVSCTKCLCQELLSRILYVGAPVQDRCTGISLAQDVCVKISAAGSSRTTCAVRISCPSVRMSASGDLPVRISAPRSCGRTTCARSLYADLLRKISASCALHQGPVGPLVQYLCMSGRCLKSPQQRQPQQDPGACRTTCARSVYEDPLCKMSVSRSQ